MNELHKLPTTIYHRADTVPDRASTLNRHPNRKKRLGRSQPPPKNSNTIATDGIHKGHSAPNDEVDKNTLPNVIYNNKINGSNDTSNSTTSTQPQTKNKQLTMSTPDPPSGSGPSRRRVQRIKRGGHQSQLGTQAR